LSSFKSFLIWLDFWLCSKQNRKMWHSYLSHLHNNNDYGQSTLPITFGIEPYHQLNILVEKQRFEESSCLLWPFHTNEIVQETPNMTRVTKGKEVRPLLILSKLNLKEFVATKYNRNPNIVVEEYKCALPSCLSSFSRKFRIYSPPPLVLSTLIAWSYSFFAFTNRNSRSTTD